MAEQPVGHRLEGHRPQAVAARDGRGRQIDAAMLEIGDRAGGVRQVVHVEQLEAELLGHDAHGAVGERARDVAGGLELLLGELLDRTEVVVAVAHPQAQLGVRPARLFGRGDRFALTALQLAMQAEDRLDRVVGNALRDPHGRDAELAEDRPGLRALQLDLESRAPVGRLGRQKIGDFDAGRGGDRLQQRQLGLALAVLDQAQLAAGDPHQLAQLVECEPLRDPLVADAVAERGQFEGGGRHSLMIVKETHFLRPKVPETARNPSHSGGRTPI